MGAATFVGCAILTGAMLAGCTTSHPAAGTVNGPTPSGPQASSASATPRQRAAADAASILASFVTPPGAVRFPGAASVDGGALKQSGPPQTWPESVDDVSWWHVPGEPTAVLAWEKAHLPGAFTAQGVGWETTPLTLWSEQFVLPAVPGVLYARGLFVTALAVGGQSVLRVDAEVGWLPPKPASERVPSDAKTVTIAAMPGFDKTGRPPAPVVIADPAKVQRIASLVDGLSLLPPGPALCLNDTDRALRLTFSKDASGPVLAVVIDKLSGCAYVLFTVGGKTQPTLSDGPWLAAQVLAVAGLRWSGY